MKHTQTIRWGNAEVPLLSRSWPSKGTHPYRKTYLLKPGESWFDIETTDKQSEAYVWRKSEDTHVPVGAEIAKELVNEGAYLAVFTEMFPDLVLVDKDVVCVECSGEIGEIVTKVRQQNSNRLAGFPDVFALFAGGTIAFREAKNASKRDKLRPNQHAMADILRQLFGD